MKAVSARASGASAPDTGAARSELARLIEALESARGADRDLDRRIDQVIARMSRSNTDVSAVASSPIPHYTSSVSTCIALMERILPDWKWHLGYGVKGIFPYASLSNSDVGRCQSSAPSVPLAMCLAILRAIEVVEDRTKPRRNKLPEAADSKSACERNEE